MFYNTPAKGDDGLYFVKATNDDMRKCLVQLNAVTVSEVSGEMVFDINSETNANKITAIESQNLSAAHDNCVEWFGKQLSEKVITGAYRSVITGEQMTADMITDPPVRIFNTNQESLDIDSVQVGKTCDVIVEFAGLWFAKKAFGGHWNVVQVRVHDDPVKEEPVIDVYPDEYAFVDEPEPSLSPSPSPSLSLSPKSQWKLRRRSKNGSTF
jgi:hypothetical protein